MIDLTDIERDRLHQLANGPAYTRTSIDRHLERAGYVACHWPRTGAAGRTTTLTPAGSEAITQETA